MFLLFPFKIEIRELLGLNIQFFRLGISGKWLWRDETCDETSYSIESNSSKIEKKI